MLLRKSCSALLLTTALLAAQPINVNSMLTQYERQLAAGQTTPDQLQRNVASLSGKLQPYNSNRAANYLNSLRSYGGHNRNLGLAMSGVYRQIGGMQNNPQDAWLNYRNAYIVITPYANDPQVQGEMRQLRQSVAVVEAQLPSLPKLDWPSLDAAAQKAFDEIMERYISVSAAVASAEQTAESMRRSMADQGLSLRPEIIASLTRMKLKHEDSKRLIEQRNYATAKDRLASAEAEASRILKSFGG